MTMRTFFFNGITFSTAGALILIASCSKPNEPAAKSLPPAKVRVQQIENQKYRPAEEVVGTVRPKLHATLEAKVSGRIQKMLVAAGQSVKQGELLVQLEVREIQAKLDQAKALREQAASDERRYEALVRQNAATRQEYEAVQARFRVAEAALVEAQTMLGYAAITAPFDGVITHKLADVGDLASPGRPLLEMETPHKLRLEADLPAGLIARVQLGNKLPVRISDLTNVFEGVVDEISPTADPRSRTFGVKVELPAAPELRAGQFGRVAVPLEESLVLLVPTAAVVHRGQMEIVFVVANSRAQLRLVKTGKRLGDEIEILSGLNPGESIVTSGAATLVDGQPLEVMR